MKKCALKNFVISRGQLFTLDEVLKSMPSWYVIVKSALSVMPRLQAVVSVCDLATAAVSLVLSALVSQAGALFNKLKGKKS